MTTTNEPLKQPTFDYGDYELAKMKASTGSAYQKTGFDQSFYEETQSKFDLIKRVDTLENEFQKLKELLTISTITIYSLKNSDWKLVNPINIAIEQRSPKEFIACLYDIDLYGYGESIPEALEDLKEVLVNQLEFLKDQDEKINFGDLPNNQLKFLNSIIARVDD